MDGLEIDPPLFKNSYYFSTLMVSGLGKLAGLARHKSSMELFPPVGNS
jgi:hypothetical protein